MLCETVAESAGQHLYFIDYVGMYSAVPGKVAFLEETKNGDRRAVPLSSSVSVQRADNCRPEFDCGDAALRALETADGGAAGTGDHDFMHVDLLGATAAHARVQ